MTWLNHLSPMFHFYTPWKRQKTKGYLTFSGGSGFIANIYLLKVNNENTIKRCEKYSKLTLKAPEKRHWCYSSVFIANICFYRCFEQVNVRWVIMIGTPPFI